MPKYYLSALTQHCWDKMWSVKACVGFPAILASCKFLHPLAGSKRAPALSTRVDSSRHEAAKLPAKGCVLVCEADLGQLTRRCCYFFSMPQLCRF